MASTALATAIKPASYESGQHVFIYCHIRTKQTVYSLTRRLEPTKALKQIPFLGKQTQQHNIRGDYWRPLATVTFPTGHQGKQAYRQLREFKIRHEHEWKPRDLKVRVTYDMVGRPHYDRLDAGKKVRNQKANTIADLAFVLGLQKQRAKTHAKKAQYAESKITEARDNGQVRMSEVKAEMAQLRKTAISGDTAAHARYKSLKIEKMRLRKQLELPRPDMAIQGAYHPLNDKAVMPKRGVKRRMRMRALVPRFQPGIRVTWADIRDAELAQSWPSTVEHDELERGRVRDRQLPEPILPGSERPMPVDVEDAALEAVTIDESASSPPPKSMTTLERIVDRLQNGAR